jgi:hypothetical protein
MIVFESIAWRSIAASRRTWTGLSSEVKRFFTGTAGLIQNDSKTSGFACSPE